MHSRLLTLPLWTKQGCSFAEVPLPIGELMIACHTPCCTRLGAVITWPSQCLLPCGIEIALDKVVRHRRVSPTPCTHVHRACFLPLGMHVAPRWASFFHWALSLLVVLCASTGNLIILVEVKIVHILGVG